MTQLEQRLISESLLLDYPSLLCRGTKRILVISPNRFLIILSLLKNLGVVMDNVTSQVADAGCLMSRLPSKNKRLFWAYNDALANESITEA